MDAKGTWTAIGRCQFDSFPWDLAHLSREMHRRAAQTVECLVNPKKALHPVVAGSHAAGQRGDLDLELYVDGSLNAPIRVEKAMSPVFLELESAFPHHSEHTDAIAYSHHWDFYLAGRAKVANMTLNPKMGKSMTRDLIPENGPRYSENWRRPTFTPEQEAFLRLVSAQHHLRCLV